MTNEHDQKNLGQLSKELKKIRAENMLDELTLDYAQEKTEEVKNDYELDGLIEDLSAQDEEIYDTLNSEGLKSYDQKTLAGFEETKEELDENNYVSPDISADDIDAYWQGGDVEGDETAFGPSPTPDQDQVDELGEAWGIHYGRTEELDILKKLKRLEENRLDNEGRSQKEFARKKTRKV